VESRDSKGMSFERYISRVPGPPANQRVLQIKHITLNPTFGEEPLVRGDTSDKRYLFRKSILPPLEKHVPSFPWEGIEGDFQIISRIDEKLLSEESRIDASVYGSPLEPRRTAAPGRPGGLPLRGGVSLLQAGADGLCVGYKRYIHPRV